MVKKSSKKPASKKPKPAKKSGLSVFLEGWLGKIAGVLVGLSYLVATITIFQTRIIPGQYFYLLVFLGITVVGYIVFVLIRNRRRSKYRNEALGLVALIVILSSGYITMLGRSLNSFLNDVGGTSSQGTNTEISKPFAVYISGVDTYGDVKEVSRSDVNIIAIVNPETKKILLVNTPRDYFVQLNGTTGLKDKLTHAGIYGIDMSKNTLEDLYQTKIDYTVRLNFTSLIKLVDALGGIEVQSDQSFSAGGHNFVVGTNSVNSKQALDFSRERHSFSAGDRQRGKNQQRVIEAIFARASQPDIILNYQNILKTLSGAFQTNASKDELSSLIRQQIETAGQWKIESISVDGTGNTSPTYSMGAQPLYVMVPNQASVDAAISAIRSYQ